MKALVFGLVAAAINAGRFTVHATSQGLLNLRPSSSRGRGNSL